MINFDDNRNEKKTKDSQKWPYIPDHPCIILVIRGCRSGKMNTLLNLINNHPDIDKTYCVRKIHIKQNIDFQLIKEK